MNLPPNLLSAFVTVFVTIGPIETAVVFAALTAGVHRPERKSLAARSITIAGVVLLLFALGGGAVLSLLRVSLPAFRVAGGALLFLQALTLTFSNPGLSSINASETRDAQGAGDIAIFPLAFSGDRRPRQSCGCRVGHGPHGGLAGEGCGRADGRDLPRCPLCRHARF